MITGGSGLGKMIARGFIANGASSICLVDMNGDRLSAVKTELEALAKDLDKTCSVTTYITSNLQRTAP